MQLNAECITLNAKTEYRLKLNAEGKIQLNAECITLNAKGRIPLKAECGRQNTA
jgi:hypothetical protein